MSENVVDTKPMVATEERRKLKLKNQRQKGEMLKTRKAEEIKRSFSRTGFPSVFYPKSYEYDVLAIRIIFHIQRC